jgi:hypothetical protein
LYAEDVFVDKNGFGSDVLGLTDEFLFAIQDLHTAL